MRVLAAVLVVAACAHKTAEPIAGPSNTNVETKKVEIKNVPPHECGVVTVEILKGGVWLGATDGKACFGKRAGSTLDSAWLEAALQPFVVDCRPSVQVAAEMNTAYGDVFATMDTIVRLGLVEVSVSLPDKVIHAPGANPEAAPAQCETVTATGRLPETKK